ncbi:hypothetical protein JHK82_050540 [Glycine max]|nr:hypothetical protein JHK85_051251 [Glycine max]KAG5091762.1 hypothetical protein JHK82_050540 [Glycine max]KAG5094861.1 hypothetical protein JHK84_050449 [Glycine max]
MTLLRGDAEKFERWQKEIEEVDIQVEGSEFGSLSGNVGRTGVGEDYERPSTGFSEHFDLCHLEVVEHACGMETLQMGEYFSNVSSGIDTYNIREPLGVCAGASVMLAELAMEAGLPNGVLNIVHGTHANMGAKNHVVVMPNASGNATVNALVAASFGAAGQSKLLEHAKALKVNVGTEPDADLSPVISK